jgi:aryl-alcohol dehydrogenase-like predicted oxidoreductase
MPSVSSAKLHRRPFGKTGIEISALAFGAGPVSALMVGDCRDRQRAVVQHAIERGINWFDTAVGYGAGESERNLGRVLNELGAASQVHVASKVRLTNDNLRDIRGAVRRSLEASLERLRLPRLSLLQLHNSITRERDDEPTSITPGDVLRDGGVLDTLEELRNEGLVLHIGLTGLGHPAPLTEVIGSQRFATMQTPYHLLNPSAGCDVATTAGDANYGNIIAAGAAAGMVILAIRVLAGGALADNPPSEHTLKTPFFPLALYERDREKARRLQQAIGPARQLPAEAVRFALAHPHIHSAIIGFADVGQIDDAIEAANSDTAPLPFPPLE